MCEDLEGEALNTVVVNKLRGFPVCVVKSPSFGDNRKAILQDLAILTRSHVISDETGSKIEDALPGSPFVGTAKRIIVTKDTTTIIGGSASEEEINERVNQLECLIKDTKDNYDREKLEERRAKLTGGVAVVSVGGKTEAELKEKKDLVDDAFNAVKAALKNGIVSGGGVALLEVKKQFDNWKENNLIENLVGDEQIGVNIFCSALDAPVKMILGNAGEPADVIISKILENENANYGYDVLNKAYGDMIQFGIIDPASVIISEIDNASSIAGSMLTTSGAIVDVDPSDKKVSQGCSGSCNGMM